MLFLLSPAKSLDFETPLPEISGSAPLFSSQAKALIDVLRTWSASEVAQHMDLSVALAELNVARWRAWSMRATPRNARPAVLAFNGDVYGGLQARSLSPQDLDWAQAHVCLLSGLYGVLRPLDWMQPYRLEMGTRLDTERGHTLYEYWRPTLAKYLRQRLRADASGVLVNLASQEYFRAVPTDLLKARVLHCVFQEERDGQYKVISFMAKRARGLMARYAIRARLTQAEQLCDFREEGYAFDPGASQPDSLVFRRRQTS